MVRAPRRAEAAAASTPACPPPITTTSQAAVAPARLAVERVLRQAPPPPAAAAAAARARRLMAPRGAAKRLRQLYRVCEQAQAGKIKRQQAGRLRSAQPKAPESCCGLSKYSGSLSRCRQRAKSRKLRCTPRWVWHEHHAALAAPRRSSGVPIASLHRMCTPQGLQSAPVQPYVPASRLRSPCALTDRQLAA